MVTSHTRTQAKWSLKARFYLYIYCIVYFDDKFTFITYLFNTGLGWMVASCGVTKNIIYPERVRENQYWGIQRKLELKILQKSTFSKYCVSGVI